jgi:hypothetical protein
MQPMKEKLEESHPEFAPSQLPHFNLLEEVGRAKCPIIDSPEDVIAVFEELLLLDCEILLAVAIGTDRRIVHWKVLSLGANSDFRVVDAFVGAIQTRAGGMLLVQTRKKSQAPSADDGDITARVRAAGNLLGYPLLDHIVMSPQAYWNLVPRPEKGKVASRNSRVDMGIDSIISSVSNRSAEESESRSLRNGPPRYSRNLRNSRFRRN